VSQWHSPAALRDAQEDALSRLLRDIRQNVDWYRQPAYSSCDDVSALPTISKQDIKSSRARFLRDPSVPRCVTKTTGGSTGEPVTLIKTSHAMERELAAAWRGYEWAGVGIGSRQARFWGVPHTRKGRVLACATDFICNRVRFSAFRFSDDELAAYAERFRRFRPTYAYGYVSMLASFGRYLSQSGFRCDWDLRAVVSTAEVLTPRDREVIQQGFGCRVFNEYGCGEVGTIAHECEHGRLHVNDENVLIEILDGDRVCAPGEKGEIVVTELHNVAMPLIRYRTGDFGRVSAQSCECGRGLTVLDDVHGRAYDFVVDSQGRRYHGEFLVYLFEDLQRRGVALAQFQVAQFTVDDLEIRVVPMPTTNEPTAAAAIVAGVKRLLGQDVRVRIEWLQSIPREPSGKMRVIVGMPMPADLPTP
jgi:phenylacetate-CoA ligase